MSFTNGSSRQFVDTNILVYVHDQNARSKQTLAQELVKYLWETEQGCLSLQVLQEFYVTVTRKWINPLHHTIAIQALRDYSHWQIHRPTTADLINAALLQQQYQISYWDALIIQSAKQMNCTIIWSEDLNKGQRYQNIPVRSPFP